MASVAPDFWYRVQRSHDPCGEPCELSVTDDSRSQKQRTGMYVCTYPLYMIHPIPGQQSRCPQRGASGFGTNSRQKRGPAQWRGERQRNRRCRSADCIYFVDLALTATPRPFCAESRFTSIRNGTRLYLSTAAAGSSALEFASLTPSMLTSNLTFEPPTQASESRLYSFSGETKEQLRKFRLTTSRAKDPQAVICASLNYVHSPHLYLPILLCVRAPRRRFRCSVRWPTPSAPH